MPWNWSAGGPETRPPRDQGATEAWNYPEIQALSRETLLKQELRQEQKMHT